LQKSYDPIGIGGGIAGVERGKIIPAMPGTNGNCESFQKDLIISTRIPDWVTISK
jgi:hypothetical protein